jgi:hypothetical protein
MKFQKENILKFPVPKVYAGHRTGEVNKDDILGIDMFLGIYRRYTPDTKVYINEYLMIPR